MIFLIWIAVITCAVALYYHEVYSRFRKYGVNHIKPLPVVGNSGPILLRKVHFVHNLSRLYQAFPEDRFTGVFEFVRPKIVIKDLELIKKIVIKDFEYFLDHSPIVDETVDIIFGRNLFSLTGQEWKDMRSTLSPAFTSAKIRLMVPFMNEVNDQMIRSLKKSIQDSNDKYFDTECRDLLARFSNDVIASCAFGVKVDSHNEKGNEFYKMGKMTTNITFKHFIKIIAFNSFPKLLKKLNFTFFGKSTMEFFKSLVLNMMNEREVNKIYRPDMIHLLMEAKKGKLTHDAKNINDDDAGFATVEETEVGKRDVDRESSDEIIRTLGLLNKRNCIYIMIKVWTDNDLIAQALLFFFAGFETVSTTMSFLLYEVAVNPKIQKRLLQEIEENHSKSSRIFDYKSVQNMTYMDMVVSETLRRWPPVPDLDRICKKDYNLGKPNSKAPCDYIIRQGEVVNIPAWAIHHDPKYYPNPDKFDPERFSEENKHLIKPFTYFPFGLGPRNCIGSRFALCEIKVMLYHLLLNFELSTCDKTCIPPKLDMGRVNMTLKDGHWLRFKIRQQ